MYLFKSVVIAISIFSSLSAQEIKGSMNIFKINTTSLKALNEQSPLLKTWIVKDNENYRVSDEQANKVRKIICDILTNNQNKYVLGTKLELCDINEVKITANIKTGSALNTKEMNSELDDLISASYDSILLYVTYLKETFIFDVTKGYAFGFTNKKSRLNGYNKIEYMVHLKGRKKLIDEDSYATNVPELPNKITEDMTDSFDSIILIDAPYDTKYGSRTWIIDTKDFALLGLYRHDQLRCPCPSSLTKGNESYSMWNNSVYHNIKDNSADVYFLSAKVVK